MRRLAAPLALLFACVLAVPGAYAQSLGSVRVDDVRTDPKGHHRVQVSVVDDDGTPVPGLEAHFSARLDGRDMPGLVAAPLRSHQPRERVDVVVDAGLLGAETLPSVQEALRGLLPALGSGDELRVLAVGRSVKQRRAGVEAAPRLIDGLGSLAGSDPPVLYDALYAAARDAARLGADRGSVVLLVTRGLDGGSGRTQLQVLAMARSRERLTPVFVTVVGDEGAAPEADPLQRLAQHTAGVYARVGSPSDLASALSAQLARGLGRYQLDFTATGYDAKAPQHTLEVTVAVGDDSRRTETTYATAEALPQAWWRSPLPWLILAGLVLLTGTAWLLLQKRQLCLLVHDGDEQDGIWYEIFALPVTLGGAEGNDIVFPESEVSRNHAVMERRGRNIELADLNSENGTLVNGERITRRALADGDRISLGDAVHLIFEARS